MNESSSAPLIFNFSTAYVVVAKFAKSNSDSPIIVKSSLSGIPLYSNN
jgi:hypothetical protein